MAEQTTTETETNQRSEEVRRSVVDRRTGLERLRGPGRRRSDFTRSAEEGEMTGEQFLFIAAIDTFKRVNGKQFPTWTEVLHVMRQLGYRKTAASELNLPNTDDWTEAADAPAMAVVEESATSEEDKD